MTLERSPDNRYVSDRHEMEEWVGDAGAEEDLSRAPSDGMLPKSTHCQRVTDSDSLTSPSDDLYRTVTNWITSSDSDMDRTPQAVALRRPGMLGDGWREEVRGMGTNLRQNSRRPYPW